MERFKALVVDKEGDKVSLNIVERTPGDLPEGEVTIRVAFSSFNYKDGLTCIPGGKVAKRYPLVPGVDLAGVVMDSVDPRFKEGDEVLVTGFELGMSHDGGFSEVARVPADWVVPLPEGLTLRTAMALGIAGFTAALSLVQMEHNGLAPENGPVIVTGATGGVGSVAVALLAQRGYHVAGSTGKPSEESYLRKLGAKEILTREEVSLPPEKPMESGRWAGAVDPVGGATLAYLIRTMQYGGVIANSGLTGGAELVTTVYPFILRGVMLLGIDAVQVPMDLRLRTWDLLAKSAQKGSWLDEVGFEARLEDVPDLVGKILKGKVKGRTIIRLG